MTIMKRLKVIALLFIGIPFLVPMGLACYSALNPEVNKTLESYVTLVNESFEEIEKKGEFKQLAQFKVYKKYDPSAWPRIGLISITDEKEKLRLFYNYDSEVNVEDYLLSNPQVKCALIKEKTFCFPMEYYNESKSKFQQSNTVLQSKKHLFKQFMKVSAKFLF